MSLDEGIQHGLGGHGALRQGGLPEGVLAHGLPGQAGGGVLVQQLYDEVLEVRGSICRAARAYSLETAAHRLRCRALANSPQACTFLTRSLSLDGREKRIKQHLALHQVSLSEQKINHTDKSVYVPSPHHWGLQCQQCVHSQCVFGFEALKSDYVSARSAGQGEKIHFLDNQLLGILHFLHMRT